MADRQNSLKGLPVPLHKGDTDRRRAWVHSQRVDVHFIPESADSVYCAAPKPALRKGHRMSRYHHGQRTESRDSLAQLSLPLDYSLSERDALSRNPGRSKARRSRLSQARLATYQEFRERRAIEQESYSKTSDAEYFRQGQRFVLTPSILTLPTKRPIGTAYTPAS